MQVSLDPTGPRKIWAPLNCPLAREGIVTCGTSGGFASPKSAAALRWEAAVSAGPARQAIITDRSQDLGTPAMTKTPRTGWSHWPVCTR